MSCKEIAELGSAFLDRELPPAEWQRLRDHLSHCPPCDEYVRQLGLTVDALKELPGHEGTELRGRLMTLFQEWKRCKR